MARSKSSHRWLRSHFDDEFVKRAQREGYRSRAVYKLDEIQQKDRILKSGMTVVDLGGGSGWLVAVCRGRHEGQGTDHRHGYSAHGAAGREWNSCRVIFVRMKCLIC